MTSVMLKASVLIIIWYFISNMLDNTDYINFFNDIPIIGNKLKEGIEKNKYNFIILIIIIVAIFI
jgi:hypothetical protein